MNVRVVALLAALVPFVAVQLTYLVAASHGLVDWCNPYLDSCTSSSATGRTPPASYLFRATMLPAAIILMAYWWLNHRWMSSLHAASGRNAPTSCHWMLALGMLGDDIQNRKTYDRAFVSLLSCGHDEGQETVPGLSCHQGRPLG